MSPSLARVKHARDCSLAQHVTAIDKTLVCELLEVGDYVRTNRPRTIRQSARCREEIVKRSLGTPRVHPAGFSRPDANERLKADLRSPQITGTSPTKDQGAKGPNMTALTNMLFSFYAQAAAPGAAPADPAAPAAAPAPSTPSAADLETARAQAAQQAATEAGHSSGGLNIFDLWGQLEPVEQGVMIILFVAAIFTVALLFEKLYVMRKTAAQTKTFLSSFRKANSVEEAEAIVRKLPASGIKSMFDAGMAEVRKTQDLGLYTMRDARDHALTRVSSAMTIKQNEHLESLGSSMTFLASIGSNAPFIGLFGTVWGIMNSFIGIVESQSTSLVAVAPGIAGALLATATGLIAAIPAVLVYNFTAKQIAKTGGKYEDFAHEFLALVSRDMDRRAA
jgi:biopolymer transport protein ExbB